jgi:hypothetical protein
MHHGSRAIYFLMALLAVVTELVSAAFGHAQAKAPSLSDATVNEIGSQPAAVIAETNAPAPKAVAGKVAKVQNFSMSPLEMRIMAYAPHLRVIATGEADSRQMASLADANERQLLFVKTTLG